jgi:hypothetical protein
MLKNPAGICAPGTLLRPKYFFFLMKVTIFVRHRLCAVFLWALYETLCWAWNSGGLTTVRWMVRCFDNLCKFDEYSIIQAQKLTWFILSSGKMKWGGPHDLAFETD